MRGAPSLQRGPKWSSHAPQMQLLLQTAGRQACARRCIAALARRRALVVILFVTAEGSGVSAIP